MIKQLPYYVQRHLNYQKMGMARWPAGSATVSEFILPQASNGNPDVRMQASSGFPRDDLVNTGRQFIGDLREGLWTFIEGLRQATVGEEAASNATSRRTRGDRTKLSSPKQEARLQVHAKKEALPQPSFHAEGDPIVGSNTQPHSKFRENHGVQDPAHTLLKACDLEKVKNDAFLSDDDGWGDWESLPAKVSSPDWSAATYRSESIDSPFLSGDSSRTGVR